VRQKDEEDQILYFGKAPISLAIHLATSFLAPPPPPPPPNPTWSFQFRILPKTTLDKVGWGWPDRILKTLKSLLYQRQD